MPEKELERLQAVNRFLTLKLSKDKELQQIVAHAARVCDSPIAMITFMTEDLQHIRFRVGTDLEQLGYNNSFCRQTILQDGVFMIDDASADPYFSDNPFVVGGPHIRFYAGVPLTTAEGDRLGTVCVYDTKVKLLTEIQQRILLSLSKQVMYLLDFDASLQLLKQEVISSRETAIVLRSFLESSSSCHLLMDKKMHILAFNKALDDITYSAQGKRLEIGLAVIPYLHPDFSSSFIAAFNEALIGNTRHLEHHLSYSVGKICWYMTFEPAFDRSEEIVGVSFNAINITQKVMQEERVREQRAALRKIRKLKISELEIPGLAVIDILKAVKTDPILAGLEERELLVSAVAELQQKMALTNLKN